MAEAIAGLSLAANILQMVEYGALFATTAWKIHSGQTDPDVVKDFKQLQYLAKDVEKVLESLGSDVSTQSSSGVDSDLASLAEECRKVTLEILEFVRKTGDQKSWRTKMQKAVKEAFKLTWGQEKLAKLQTRLNDMRDQLTLRLVNSLRHFAAASSERQEELLRRILQDMKKYNYKVDQALELGLGTVSVELIAQKLDRNLLGSQSADTRESLRSDILGVISDPKRTFTGTPSTESGTFEVSPSRREALKKKLLQNLSYPDMLFREESVVRASETTLRWIFDREQQPDRPWASFRQWLESPDQQLYWITGKPGSGKSTLMKFVSQPPAEKPSIDAENSCNEPPCLPFLKSWAASQPLIVASYYFWAIGSPMQRSKEGMLRTLLHGLLSQAPPETISTVMSESWEALHLFDEDPQAYTETTLQILLSRAFHHISPSMRICLFIDGLDEFEGQHENLVLYLRDALKSHPIKLCVSSRQWQVFEDSFHDIPHLRLQDLTLPDMMEYVRSELYAGAAFAELRMRDPSFSDNLNEDLARRSDGVFLWLKLVVKSLRKGIRAGDRVSDLQARLDKLPQDLEALFERILGDLDPEYLQHTIQYFKLMEACRDTGLPNVMVFSYADEEDETFGINCPISPLDWKTYKARRDHLKRRLNSRCMGLLEISEPRQSSLDEDGTAFLHASQSRVTFLHRTVGDFISRDKVRDSLNDRAGRGFEQDDDLHLRLCSAELGFVKSDPLAIGQKGHIRSIKSFSNKPRRNCLVHAAQVKKSGSQPMIQSVEVLESLYPVELVPYSCVPFKTGSGLGPTLHMNNNGPSFIIDAIDIGVVEYIRAKANRAKANRPTPVQTPKFWHKAPRLDAGTALRHRNTRRERIKWWSEIDWQLTVAVLLPAPIPEVVELLLEKGADPHYKDNADDQSTWKLALMLYMYTWWDNSQDREVRGQIVALMIKYGCPIENKFIAGAYKELARRMRVGEKDNAFCSTIKRELKIMNRGIR